MSHPSARLAAGAFWAIWTWMSQAAVRVAAGAVWVAGAVVGASNMRPSRGDQAHAAPGRALLGRQRLPASVRPLAKATRYSARLSSRRRTSAAGGAAQVGHGTVGLDGAHVVVELDADELAAFFEGGHREGSGACGEVEDHAAQAKGTVRTKKRRPRGFERRLLVSPDCPRGKTVSSSDTARPPSQRAFLCQLRFWKVFKGFGRMDDLSAPAMPQRRDRLPARPLKHRCHTPLIVWRQGLFGRFGHGRHIPVLECRRGRCGWLAQS